CRVGERPAAPVGHDVESLGGPARPVVQVHPPAAKVAAAALGLHQVIVPAPVAQVVTVADVAADLLTGRRGGPLDGRVQLRVGGGGPRPEAGQGAAGLSVDLAVAVVVQAQLDPGGVGVQAELADAWGALVAVAQCPRSKELAGGAGGQETPLWGAVAEAGAGAGAR